MNDDRIKRTRKRRKRVPLFRTDGIQEELVLFAKQLASLHRIDQIRLTKCWLNEIARDSALLDTLLTLVGRARSGKKWGKIERRLETLLRGNIHQTPQDAAYEARRQLRLPHDLRPMTIALARRVKARIVAEQRRSKETWKTNTSDTMPS